MLRLRKNLLGAAIVGPIQLRGAAFAAPRAHGVAIGIDKGQAADLRQGRHCRNQGAAHPVAVAGSSSPLAIIEAT